MWMHWHDILKRSLRFGLPGSNVIDIPIPSDLCPKPLSAPKSGYTVLIPFLQQQNRGVDRVLGDGNCLFRALSIQLTGTQDHNLELRKLIALFEKGNENVFKNLHVSINRSVLFLDHLENIKKSCTWGTTVKILAFIIVSGGCLHSFRYLLSR